MRGIQTAMKDKLETTSEKFHMSQTDYTKNSLL